MTVLSPAAAREAHQLLAEFSYDLRPVERGYANRTLYVNLGDLTIQSKPVTEEMKRVFTGGRGFGLWLLWNGTRPETRWNDPENELVITGGVIGGISNYPGSGKCTAVTISPQTGVPIDSNSGGYFGPYLKFAGWDAIEIQGKAEQDVIIIVDGDLGEVRVETAPLEPVDTHLIARLLTDMYGDTPKEKRGISVVSAGQAADHVAMCGLNVSYYDPRRDEIRYKQAARGGAGRVLRDKHIKAIVVRYSNMNANSNGVADMALLQKAGQRINREITQFDESQNDMRGTGTPYLVEIMNRFDLLPTQNYRFGAHDEAHKIAGDVWKPQFDRRGPDGCWYGCTMACAHAVNEYELRSGPYKGQKVFVDGPEYETLGGLGSNLNIFCPNDILELNFYCDTYGIDTISAGNSIAFVMECWENGILTKEHTGGLDFTWGNTDAALELLHQMARGEGFGLIVGQGIRHMKAYFVEHFGADAAFLQDIGMEVKGLEISEYMTKESLTQQGGYALASKGAQHDEAWLIFMELVHKQLPTFEAKAEALHYFPIWRTWFSLHGLCKLPWNDIIPESNKTAKEPAKVPEHVENYTWLYEGVTGVKVGIEDLMLQSERVYTFQRIFNARCGYGTRAYDYPPYRAMGPVTELEYESRQERYDQSLINDAGINIDGMSTAEKVAALRKYREDRYEMLVDAVYKRRGWDMNGVPTLETVKRLGIDFPEVLEVIQKHHKS
ncbi:aldehyde ferredoxin oxidoreductase family protein [Levilinea saccharolytica]|uniref:Aldehyde:ferredoxin oxidoreductase n=1 Tax=Levilinea saccharolytica TaxID=229921 RepID=A0A0P6XXZ8_9CHLR|nr:aldehyde ferredoxin oxidoreductase C-terminal domain-containing protein [Levilinea saccharolytica]KPL85072.1 aldehyde:ferredoxin oxidoreductase [Levilinea saccharolytica]GAP18178.1 aldehyde:ferredoxin oxidoreductase [Levilinea saccharolytica]